MHISEGVLSPPVLGAGAALATLGLAYGLRRMPWHMVISVGLASSAFFVASLIHVPLGPGSVHLILNGLMGAVLGWAAFPAITVALLLQALLLHFGGITTLGVNACIMAFPAVICGMATRPFFYRKTGGRIAAFCCGFGSVLLSVLFCSSALALSGEAFRLTAYTIFLFHVPVMFLEGFITLVIVDFLTKKAPDVLALKVR